MIGVTKPRARYRTLGTEFAGVVDAVGHAVTQFREGDEVFGFAGWYIGANADYLCLPANASLQRKPAGIAFAEAAAAVDGATTALHFLRDRAGLRAGQRILIIGASGSVGTYAVQLAKRLGAEVTGVCGTSNVDLVRSLGADQVLDYTRSDFADGDEHHDLILDIGGRSSVSRLRRALTRDGTLVIVGGEDGNRFTGGVGRQARAMALSPFIGQRLTTFISTEHYGFIERLAEFLDAGTVVPVVVQRFELCDVPEAMRQLAAGKASGKIAINVRPAA